MERFTLKMLALTLGAGLLHAGYADAALAKKTYDQPDNLSILYSNAPMPGKSVLFTPDASDATKGTLTLQSFFDLKDIPGVPESLGQQIAGPGVIPGSPVTVIDITLTPAGADSYSFSGNGSNEYIDYNYSGTISADALTLSINDAELKDKTLKGTWITDKYETNEWGDEVYSTPTHIVWTSDKDLTVMEGFELPMESLLGLVLAMPLLEDGTASVNQMLPELLKNIEFRNDGNATATVMEAGQYITSPLNLMQYVVKDDSKFQLFLDPTLIASTGTPQNAPALREGLAGIDLNNIIGNLLAQLAPMLSQGLPMGYIKQDNKLTVYLGDDVILPVLQQNVVPILSDTALIQEIADLLAQSDDETIAGIAPMLPGIAASLVEVINGTTKIEIGLNFTDDGGSGVKNIESAEASDRHEIGRYDIQGRKAGKDYKGIVIVRYSDGSSSKLMIR